MHGGLHTVPAYSRYGPIQMELPWEGFYCRVLIISKVIVLVFTFCSRRSRPPSWAATSRPMTNTLWRDLATRRPPSTRSSTREMSTSNVIRLTEAVHWWTVTDVDTRLGTFMLECFFHPFCCGGFIFGGCIFSALIFPWDIWVPQLKRSFVTQESCEKCTYWIK